MGGRDPFAVDASQYRGRKPRVTARASSDARAPDPRPARIGLAQRLERARIDRKEWPQPHPASTCGLRDSKPRPPRPPSYSSTVPASSGAENGSITTVSPSSCSTTSSSRRSSYSSRYWKPEQPPPWTPTRSTAPSARPSVSRRAIALARACLADRDDVHRSSLSARGRDSYSPAVSGAAAKWRARRPPLGHRPPGVGHLGSDPAWPGLTPGGGAWHRPVGGAASSSRHAESKSSARSRRSTSPR